MLGFPDDQFVATEEINGVIAGAEDLKALYAGDIEKVWANPERANKVLGWKAETSIEDTLRSAWNWQLKLRERGIQ